MTGAPEQTDVAGPPLLSASFRNARYVKHDGAVIDMDLDHPLHGWIPITITQDDYPELWEEVAASGPTAYVAPTEAETRERWRQSAILTRVEFCAALMATGILSRSEAIAAAKGDWPTSFGPMLDSMAEAEADAALILWAGIATIERVHPLLEAVRHFKGLSQEDVDALFGYTT